MAEAVKPKCGGIFSPAMQYGANFVAVGGFLFFGENDFGGSGITKIRRYFLGGNAIRRYVFGGKRFLVFRR